MNDIYYWEKGAQPLLSKWEEKYYKKHNTFFPVDKYLNEYGEKREGRGLPTITKAVAKAVVQEIKKQL